MLWSKFNGTLGALVLTLALSPVSCLEAQSTFTITVEDASGAALSGATVTDSTGKMLGRTDPSGQLAVPCASQCAVSVLADGFAELKVQLQAATTVRLNPAAQSEQVTVTAYRAPIAQLDSPVTTRLLTQHALSSTATVTLDDQLRQLPGVELFRRSSSLVANPSSQGMSLRALGSTSASRTLLTEGDVPLNDAFAGTLHWLEQPELSIQSIELVRGGASDLYGSSAIGGVMNVMPVRPTSDEVELRSSYGGEGTYNEDLLLEGKRGHYGGLISGGMVGTDGYIQESPAQQGPVDVDSFVHAHSGVLLGEHDEGSLRLFLRGSGFEEARGNGTRYQRNGTRLWRYSTGADWQGPHNGSLIMRLYGSNEHFRQTFSSISSLPNFGIATCGYRCGELPSKFSLTPNNELGATAHWSQPLGVGLLLVAGADAHDVRVWDREQSYTSSTTLTNLHDHQRDSAAYAEAMWVRNGWTLTASARFDWFQNYDGRMLQWNGAAWIPSATQPTQFDQRFFDPRLGVSRKLGEHWALSASGFRAFREPTPNELYRSTQVGNLLTKPNFNLHSERATGWEAGIATQYRWGVVRTSYFLTEVDLAIDAVTTNPNSSPILLLRENLGQIQSKGLSVDYELAPERWLTIDGGYQFADATVINGNPHVAPGSTVRPAAVTDGNWIPEVARNLATVNLRAFKPSLGLLNLQGRLSGRQFDDDANMYLLHGYFRLDAYASHDFGSRFQLFGAGENLFNRQIEDSKTPTTTLGIPRQGRFGFLVRLGRAGR